MAVVVSKPSTSTAKTNPSSGSKSSSKSSSSSQKNKSGGTYKNGGGGSSSWAYDYISDDSSDYEPPPPPDPRQYYYPLITGPYAVSNSRYYYINNELNNKKSVKSMVTSNAYMASNYSLLYQSYSKNSHSSNEMANNSISGHLFDALGVLATINKPKLKVAASLIDVAGDVLISNGKLAKSLHTISHSNSDIRYADNKSIDDKNINDCKIGNGIYMNGQGRVNKGDNSYFYGEYQIGTKGNSPKNGCGVFAAYNSMITLGNYSNPADIIKYIDDNCGLVVDSGLLGINPFIMDNYFKDNGYDAYNVYLPSKNSLDELVKNNDSVIISYAWENNGTIGAHYSESHYRDNVFYTTNLDNSGKYYDKSIGNYFAEEPHTFVLTATVINKRGE